MTDTIENLVKKVIADALKDDCKADARIEALKAVTAYHALTLKHPRRGADEVGLTWDSIQAQIHDAEDGNGQREAPVRSHPGRARQLD